MTDLDTIKTGTQALITHKRKQAFLEEYAKHGIVKQACDVAGIARQTHYMWNREDPAYASALAEARETAIDTVEQEIYRRAVEGNVKPVYYRGERVGETREYSDLLMIFLMKALAPERFQDRLRLDKVLQGEEEALAKRYGLTIPELRAFAQTVIDKTNPPAKGPKVPEAVP